MARMGIDEEGEGLEKMMCLIRRVPDWPRQGVTFVDASGVWVDPVAWGRVVSWLVSLMDDEIEVVAGLDARGFLLAGAAAAVTCKGVLAVRKSGKLPPENDVGYGLLRERFVLEYGSAEWEVNTRDVRPFMRVLVVDDLMATGGSMAAACALLQRAGAEVVRCAAMIELVHLAGRDRLSSSIEFQSLLQL
uniref:adenine phosphoribosyltransferase n=1 Tax=Compsopogon caeruleus TaxID=31354 RepID=A0A7S1TH13_9RHOD|mmetsp:Transcript_6088/g.11905  ORF Transcript_6088/g.11905 Transcript_6088/m.11905 type:complete len:190 (+) Transcript_6088:69-638(+)